MILPIILDVYLGVNSVLTVVVLVILATFIPPYLYSRMKHRQWLPRSIHTPIVKLKEKITPKRMVSRRTIASAMVGGLLLVMGTAMMYDSIYVSVRFSRTTGVVTSYIDTGEGSGYYLVVFVNQITGQQITGTTNVGVSSPIGVLGKLSVGRRVDVFYDPQSPTHIRIASIELWLWPIVFMLVGIVPIACALFGRTFSNDDE